MEGPRLRPAAASRLRYAQPLPVLRLPAPAAQLQEIGTQELNPEPKGRRLYPAEGEDKGVDQPKGMERKSVLNRQRNKEDVK